MSHNSCGPIKHPIFPQLTNPKLGWVWGGLFRNVKPQPSRKGWIFLFPEWPFFSSMCLQHVCLLTPNKNTLLQLLGLSAAISGV